MKPDIKNKIKKTIKITAQLLLCGVAGIVLYLVCFAIWHIFLFASFTIPTNSMRPTLQPGDIVLVDKITTGARLFQIFDMAKGKEVPIRRFPRFRKFKREDVLVFNYVHKDTWARLDMNLKKYYAKRCIAIPGDTMRIAAFNYIVNSDTLRRYPKPREFEWVYPPDSIARVETDGYLSERFDTIDRWTIRDYGPIVIPAKGMTLDIDTVTFRRYQLAIEWETGKTLRKASGRVLLGDKPIDKYTFKENYYFMAGDNAIGSLDSRYWGLLPEPFIVGRVAFIWWSENERGIQWKRMFRPLSSLEKKF